jgi:hypothetical protein
MATISNTDSHTITVEQGSNYTEVFTITSNNTPVPLTNYDVGMMVRVAVDTKTYKLFFTNTTSSTDTNVAFTTGTVRIIKDDSNGIFTLAILPEDTDVLSLTGDQTEWVYDIKLFHKSTDNVLLAAKGPFLINKTITQTIN